MPVSVVMKTVVSVDSAERHARRPLAREGNDPERLPVAGTDLDASGLSRAKIGRLGHPDVSHLIGGDGHRMVRGFHPRGFAGPDTVPSLASTNRTIHLSSVIATARLLPDAESATPWACPKNEVSGTAPPPSGAKRKRPSASSLGTSARGLVKKIAPDGVTTRSVVVDPIGQRETRPRITVERGLEDGGPDSRRGRDEPGEQNGLTESISGRHELRVRDCANHLGGAAVDPDASDPTCLALGKDQRPTKGIHPLGPLDYLARCLENPTHGAGIERHASVGRVVRAEGVATRPRVDLCVFARITAVLGSSITAGHGHGLDLQSLPPSTTFGSSWDASDASEVSDTLDALGSLEQA